MASWSGLMTRIALVDRRCGFGAKSCRWRAARGLPSGAMAAWYDNRAASP